MSMRLLAGMLAAALALSCGGQAAPPAAPSPAVQMSAASTAAVAAAADGSTLKVTAPAPQLPLNASVTTSLTPNLVIANATFRFLGDVALVRTLQYRFVVETADGSVVSQVLTGAGVELTGSRVPAGVLAPLTIYRWRVRAELGAGVGPWSAFWVFTTPKA